VLVIVPAVLVPMGVLLFGLWSDGADSDTRPGDRDQARADAPAGVAAPLGQAPPSPAAARRAPPDGRRAVISAHAGAANAPAASPAAEMNVPPAAATAETNAPPGGPAGAAPTRGRDGGVSPAAETRKLHPATAAATASAAKMPSRSVDAGAAAAAAATPASPDGGQSPLKRAALAAAAPRRDGVGRLEPDDAGQIKVARFAATGGSNMEGRVVDVNTGRPIAGTTVEARFEGRSVEIETDASGAFKMPGMVPGSKVWVWIGGRRDRFIGERIDVRIPENGKTADLGAIKLLDGDELGSTLDGWIGVYVGRRGGQVEVTAVNAWVPAHKAGIEVGDTILSVDGRDVSGLGSRTVGFLMRGPAGSSVTLELESSGGKRRKLTLQRVTR
jgi:hypothetical protein